MCSELSRAVQTAEIAAAVLGLPVRVRERIHEFPAGDFLGRPYDPVFFGAMVKAWQAGDLSAGVPGGETGRQTATACSASWPASPTSSAVRPCSSSRTGA